VCGPVAAVQPASHHRPSFNTSPTTTTKPPAAVFDAAQRVPPLGHRAAPSNMALTRPPTLLLSSTATAAAAGTMAGSQSNPLVGTTRQAALKTTQVVAKPTTVPRSLIATADADYMHRFRLATGQFPDELTRAVSQLAD